MENQEKTIRNNQAYKTLLIFILGFQATISTGWIIFDNYTEYSAEPTTANLLSLATSAAGLIIVLLVWVLLDGSLRSFYKNMLALVKESQTLKDVHEQSEEELHNLKSVYGLAIGDQDFESFCIAVNEISGDMLKASTASIWMFSEKDDKLRCLDTFNHLKEHNKAGYISGKAADMVFDAFAERSDAWVIESAEDSPFYQYLYKTSQKEKGIMSAMLTPIIYHEKTIGFCWYEQMQLKRNWTQKDQELAILVANAVAAGYQENEHVKTSTALSEVQHTYAQFLSSTDIAVARLSLKVPLSITATNEEKIAQLLDESMVTHYNEAFLRTMGFDEATFSPDDCAARHLMEEEGRKELLTTFIEQEHRLPPTEASIISDDGEKKYIVRSILGIVENNYLKGIWFTATDITVLKRKEAFFGVLVNHSPEPLVVLDRQDHTIYQNESARHLLAEHAANEPFTKIVHEDDHAAFRSALAEAKFEKRDVFCETVRIKKADQTWQVSDLSISNLEQNSGFEGLMMRIADVSSKIANLQTVAQEKDFFEGIAQQLPDGLLLLDPDRTIRFANEGMENVFGYAVSEKKGHFGFDHVHPSNVSEVNALFSKTLKEPGFTAALPIKYMHKNGHWLSVQLKMVQLPGDAMEDRVMLRLSQQSAQPVETAPALATTSGKEVLYENILNRAHICFLVVDEHGKIQYVGESIEEQFGYSAADLKGKNLLDFVSSTEKSALNTNLQYLEADHSAQMTMNLQMKHKNGEWRKVEAAACHLSEHNLEPSVLFQLEDITEKSKNESEVSFRARFYHALVSNISLPVLFLDQHGSIKYTSQKVQDMLGYQPKTEFIKWLHSDFHKSFQERLKETIENRLPKATLPVKIMEKDGVWLDFELTLVNMSETSSFKGVLAELTPPQSGEGLLEKAPVASAFYATIKESPDYVFLFLNDQGKIHYHHGQIERHLGIQPAQLSEHTFEQLLSEASQEIYRKAIEKAKKSPGKAIRKELEIPTKGGSKWLYASFSYVEADQSIAVVGQSITNLKQAFARMEKDALYVRWLLDETGEVVILSNRNHEVVYANQATAKILGIRPVNLDEVRAIFEVRVQKIWDNLMLEALSADRGATISTIIYQTPSNLPPLELSISNLLEVSGIEGIKVVIMPLIISEEEMPSKFELPPASETPLEQPTGDFQQADAHRDVVSEEEEEDQPPTESAEGEKGASEEVQDNETAPEAAPEPASNPYAEENPPLPQEEKPLSIPQSEEPGNALGLLQSIKKQLSRVNGHEPDLGQVQAYLKRLASFKNPKSPQEEEEVAALQKMLNAPTAEVRELLTELEALSEWEAGDLELMNLNDAVNASLKLYINDFTEDISIDRRLLNDNWIYAEKMVLFRVIGSVMAAFTDVMKEAGSILVMVKKEEEQFTLSFEENVTEKEYHGIAETFPKMGEGQKVLDWVKNIQAARKLLIPYHGDIFIKPGHRGLQFDIMLPKNFGYQADV